MQSNVDIIILVCRVNTSWGWDCGSWSNWNNCNHDHRNYHDDCVVVESSSDRRIPRGASCAQAMDRLLTLGYRLINTATLDSNCGQIVHTFARYTHHHHDDDNCSVQQPAEDGCGGVC
ncbi:hypothetical protein GOM49_02530 [Clostridium bovifaecis]|uniref:Uncharacterized protein n=1 Tax=Clostridium bovifaecis TaxID=2184719 RepID=A0A6I6EPZ8_9CLOT|nr:hypothetical protein GOM49_02530 [Clostridium bovifaecis]